MRVQRLRIDGFGHFADTEWGAFERPVTVFHGPNEAGKSTLLQFVRQVLFGFPSTRNSKHYPAFAGGRYGGSVTIVSDSGETVIVQRTFGTRGGPLTLTSAEGEPLPDSELQRLLGHTEDVFGKVSTFTLDELHTGDLLSDDSVNSQIYSVGMGAPRLPPALDRLDKEKSKLFLKGGSTQAIYHAAERLRNIDAKLKEVERNAEEYSRLTVQLKDAEAEQAALHERRLAIDSELKAQENLAGAWPDWNDLATSEQGLAGLPPTGDFPANGVSRLETLEADIRRKRQAWDSAQRDAEEARAGAEAPIENEAMGAHAAAIRGIEQGRKAFDDSVHDLPERQVELVNHDHSLQEAFQRLGTDWDESRLDTFDMSLVVEDEIRQYRQRLEDARNEIGRREVALNQNETLLSEAVDAKGKAEREAGTGTAPTGRKNGNRLLAVSGAAAGIMLLVIGAVLGGAALVVGAAAGIVLIGMAAYLLVFGRSSTDADPERERLARELDSSIALAERRKSRAQESKEAVEEAMRALEEAQKDWQQWLVDRGLRETFSPDLVADLRGRVDIARGHLANVREWQRRIAAIRKDIDEYAERVQPLASEFGIPFDKSDSRTVAAAAAQLTDLHTAVADRVRQRAEVQRSLERAQRDVHERGNDLSVAEVEMKALLQSGSAESAEDFRNRAKIHEQRSVLEEERRDLLARLQGRSGPGERLERLKQSLQDTDIQTIEDAIRRASEERNEIGRSLDELANQRAELRTSLDRLTSEESSSWLRAEHHRLLEEMRGYARDWTVLAIAENLLKEAQSKFERERQPDVIRHSQEFFRDITQGRYQTVFSPLDKPEIHVSDGSGSTKQPNELSRGTREQLFLSLRFGYIRDLGQRAERLPLLVDEALVNFDPERGMSAAVAFTNLAQTNQVLVFTCHPQIVDWFVTAAVRLGVEPPQVIDI